MKFKRLTSGSNLSSIFKNGSVLAESRLWLKTLKNMMYKSFPVVKLKRSPKSHIVHEKMVQKANFLAKIYEVKKCVYEEQYRKIEDVLYYHEKVEVLDVEIADIISEQNAKKIREHYCQMTEFGSFNVTKMWKLKKRILPDKTEKPSAKKDAYGNLVCDKKSILSLYRNEYIKRLSSKPPSPSTERVNY